MENILDGAEYLSIEKRFLHCVPINENQSNYAYNRRGTTNRCYTSRIDIDGKDIPIIFVSNGSEMTSKRVRVKDAMTSFSNGVRYQNYDKYYVSELDGKTCIVTIADKYCALGESCGHYLETIFSKKILKFAYVFITLFLIRL